ncbi:TIGR04282 family arsenosugar biosynthesis glycosyltransferase [Methylomonas koyamae]|uniref:TIGR04282 family arsenosugar biosynthesis glycosyltransferase n=1 Tax=Methylomonas koyamae TaxID=702114 RepID=UPI001129CA3B|nr:TIGR04282 family arsenosugar biosynthesis glycosyltransferase [Methylomonas koyamae]TPQ29065.1 hypothetical protein C2U68_03690 [Methylomonas koyamae]
MLFPDSVLLIFCKAPIPGQVKTRLQPALNAEQATNAHRQLAKMTLDRAVQQPLCPVELYCAPDANHAFFQDCARIYPITLHEQYGIDLGIRMHLALDSAFSRYRYALLMGCDCPSLTFNDIHQAFMKLREGHDVVVAPAEDGGYVMIGLNSVQPTLFSEMVWSNPQVMANTRRRAKESGLSMYELAMQWDVDTYQDWQRYLEVVQLKQQSKKTGPSSFNR